jgi:hypothetical protein
MVFILAYFALPSVTKTKSLIASTPVVNVIKLFLWENNKPECLFLAFEIFQASRIFGSKTVAHFKGLLWPNWEL